MKTNNHGAILFTHNGRFFNVPWHGAGLDELRRLMNCDYVEAVRLRGPLEGLSMWCDEEGKLKDHCANYPASLLYRCLCGGDYMAGRCVILADDDNGDSIPLTCQQRNAVYMTLLKCHDFIRTRGERIRATGPRCEIIEL